MAKRKRKAQPVILPLEESNIIHIHIDSSSVPNKMHLDAQQRFPHLIREDKRRKKPKYKNINEGE